MSANGWDFEMKTRFREALKAKGWVRAPEDLVEEWLEVMA